MPTTRRQLWLGLSLAAQAAACGPGRLRVDAAPALAGPVEIVSPGPHFYLVNDYPGSAEIYLLANGA